MPARIKSDDQVIVISGKDRGKQGKVLRVDSKNDRVFVEGLEHDQAPPEGAADLSRRPSRPAA